ncbi:MAG: hypothetical protein QXP42_04510 [Candidatus Micrarchaeia archaeon]
MVRKRDLIKDIKKAISLEGKKVRKLAELYSRELAFADLSEEKRERIRRTIIQLHEDAKRHEKELNEILTIVVSGGEDEY